MGVAPAKRRTQHRANPVGAPGFRRSIPRGGTLLPMLAPAVLAIEVLAERVETLAEVRGELVDPGDDIAQRSRAESIEAMTPVTPHADELRLFEHAQMLGDRRERHVERPREIAGRSLAIAKAHQHGAPRGMSDSVKNVIVLDWSHGSTRGTPTEARRNAASSRAWSAHRAELRADRGTRAPPGGSRAQSAR